ncbi:MAG: hypothetical protein WC349_03825 [Patescibacteria group bacterium]|jgi:uncharacterized Zn finger protein
MSVYTKDEVIAFTNKSGEMVCWDCVPENKKRFGVVRKELFDGDAIITCDKCGEIIYF